MDPQLAATAYQHASIENAPPIKVIRMMYEGALRFLERASACDAADPTSEFNYWLGRADAIVSELRVCLDHEQNAEVSENLENLYLFCEREISQAQNDRSKKPIENARRVLETLNGAWVDVELQARSARSDG